MPLYIKNNKVISSNDITSTGIFRTKINRDSLILHLDAGDVDSYPGSGSDWYDLSGNGYNFVINASAYNSSGPKYMDFNGSYGCAKKTSTDVPLSGNVTCICWTRVKNSTAELNLMKQQAQAKEAEFKKLAPNAAKCGWNIKKPDGSTVPDVEGYKKSGWKCPKDGGSSQPQQQQQQKQKSNTSSSPKTSGINYADYGI